VEGKMEGVTEVAGRERWRSEEGSREGKMEE
jgi:hypothetical protein